jgi:ribonuclease D
MLYTASYFQPENHHGQLISISRSRPAKFQQVPTLDFFAPTQDLLDFWHKETKTTQLEAIPQLWTQYQDQFFEILDDRTSQIEDWIAQLNPAEDYTLCCWERTTDRIPNCHRNDVGALLAVRCKELWGGFDVIVTLQERAWNSPEFEICDEDGTKSIWFWVDKPTDSTSRQLTTKWGTKIVQLKEIKKVISESCETNLPPQACLVQSEAKPCKVFVQPQKPPIDFNDPVVILNPQTPDYQAQLKAIAQADLLVLDLETYGETNYKHGGLHPWDGRIRLVQLFDGKTVWIADLGGRSLNTLPLFATCESERDVKHQQFQEFFEVLRDRVASPECRIVGHNIHFDLRMLATQLGIKAQNIACTLVGAKVYFGDYGKGDDTDKKGASDPILSGGYGLGNLIKRWFNMSLDKSQQKSDWGGYLTNEQIEYAARDVIATWYLYQELQGLYSNKKSALYSSTLLESWEVENRCIPVAVDIECWGMPVDLALVEVQGQQIEIIRQQLLQEWEQINPNVTYNQTAELTKLLAEQYNIHLEKLDKTELAAHQDNPLVKLRLKLKALDVKLNNLKAFARSAVRDGRVHTTFRTLTGFGRFSSGESKNFDDLPNLQSISAKDSPMISEYKLPNPRSTIKPPPGYVMGVIDLAGAHGRIAADQAEDETAIAGNNDESIDNHSKVAVYIAKCQGLDWTWEDIARLRNEKSDEGKKAKAFRDTAKNTYYGWLNGAGAGRIQAQITANTGKEPKIEDCEAAIEGCKVLYPKVLKHREALHKRLVKTAVEVDGRKVAVNKTSDGFRILLPLVPNRKNPDRLEAPYTQSLAAIWTRIEATAVKRALPKIQKLISQYPEWDLQIIGVVHDEVDVLVKEEFSEVALPQVNDLIGDEFKTQLKYVVDGRTTNWKKLIVQSWADK